MGELRGAAESVREEVRKMAGWLARSLAVARKGWKGQGRDHLQPPWSLCIPSLLSREGRPDPEFWSMRPEGEGLRGRARVVWRTEPVQAEWTEQRGTQESPEVASARGQDGSGRTEPYPGDLRGHSPELESLRDMGMEPCTPMLACPCC